MRAVLDAHAHELVPGMMIEVTSDQFAVFRPFVAGIGSTVHADEALAVLLNKRQKSGLLLVIHLQLAGGVEKDRIEIIQILAVACLREIHLGDQLSISADKGVPEPG